MASHPTSRPTIYDVAAEAGVSKSLVSLVLNASDLVSAPKREAVLAAIEPARLPTQPGSDRARSRPDANRWAC